MWKAREERLILAAKILSGFVSRLFETRYDVSGETYLPSYRIPGQKAVAVLFADIRNFTPVTEILRNFGRIPDLNQFMLNYCREMFDIIASHGGRVDGLAGDGIRALFGEYDSKSDKVVASTVVAAKQMCLKFEALKKAFFATPPMREFFHQEYEPLDLDLGIGVNFGPVIFDYFGAPGSRVYSPLGDHVNFAQRLEAEANRFDAQLRRARAPILLSRPVHALLGQPPELKPVSLQMKGKSYEYQAFECWPDSTGPGIT